MIEKKLVFSSMERARNAAIRELEKLGARFDRTTVVRGNAEFCQPFYGNETGVQGRCAGIWWRLRLDWDPDKGLHYNIEYGKTHNRKVRMAFCFPGDLRLARRLGQNRAPR